MMLVSLNKNFWLNRTGNIRTLNKKLKTLQPFLNPRYLSKESFFFIMNNDIKSPTLKCQLKLDVIFYAYVLYEKNQWKKADLWNKLSSINASKMIQ